MTLEWHAKTSLLIWNCQFLIFIEICDEKKDNVVWDLLSLSSKVMIKN